MGSHTRRKARKDASSSACLLDARTLAEALKCPNQRFRGKESSPWERPELGLRRLLLRFGAGDRHFAEQTASYKPLAS